MEEIIIKPTTSILKWLVICSAIFFVVLLILTGASIALAYTHENKIYPGIMIDGINIGGLTKTQAGNIISGKFKQTYDPGFTFIFENTKKNILDPNNQILSLNLESMVDKAFNLGRKSSWLRRHAQLLVYPITKKQLPLDYQFDKGRLKQQLQSEFIIWEKPAKNSTLLVKIIDPKEKTYELEFTPAEIGEAFNFNEAIDQLEAAVEKLANQKIQLTKTTSFPAITKENAQTQASLINELLAIPEINLAYNDKTWTVKWEDFSHWLELIQDEHEAVTVGLNREMVMGHLQGIAQEIDQPAIDAKLQIVNGRVTEFQASQNGQQLNWEENFALIQTEILKNKNQHIQLVVSITEPKVSVGSTNELGIGEKIGAGWSDFTGSPSNRRHNIGIGAAALNGVLVKPDEEFSLIKTLGEIDAASGYKPELVIKQSETIPEFGGGLCQIGTTFFRAALQSGLKITARRPHSYRVVYYEPAGTDATIYSPWPDVKFINDTVHYILIQTKVRGNTLTFEFWGTSDGRKVSFEGENKVDNLRYLKPTIFNITKPGPAKEIETTELAPGERKKTESAHNGADAVFYQYITKPGQETEKITWSSHYVPWQEVWLVGVDPAKKAAEAAAQEALKAETAPEEKPEQPETEAPATTD